MRGAILEYLLNESGQVLSETTFLDSRFRGNPVATPLLIEMLHFGFILLIVLLIIIVLSKITIMIKIMK